MKRTGVNSYRSFVRYDFRYRVWMMCVEWFRFIFPNFPISFTDCGHLCLFTPGKQIHTSDITFQNKNNRDSLSLASSILHLVVTVFIQYFLMRDLEKLTGSLRIGFIYIGSGVAGNLASAIFVPYRADVSWLWL